MTDEEMPTVPHPLRDQKRPWEHPIAWKRELDEIDNVQDRAKIEALRAIAEEINKLTRYLTAKKSYSSIIKEKTAQEAQTGGGF